MHCNNCPMQGKKQLQPEGSPNAPIVIVRDMPDHHEIKQGKAFSSYIGKIFNSFLTRAGINKSDCYITSVVKCMAPKGATGRSAQEHCVCNFDEEMRTLKPKVIVPMGEVALNALGIFDKLKDTRGYLNRTRYGIAVPTYHPSAVMKQQQEFVTVGYDWRKIQGLAKLPHVPKIQEKFIIQPTIEEVEEWAYTIEHRAAKSHVTLAMDIETFITDNPLQTPLKTFGCAMNETEAIVVPFITQSSNFYWRTKDQATRATVAIGKVLENPSITKVFHNALFDVLVLRNLGFRIVGPIYDTMLGHFLVYHPVSHALSYLTSVYADYEPWKLADKQNDKQFQIYNARDCTVLHMILPHLQEDIDSNGCRVVFENLMKVILPTCQMTLNGIHIDQQLATQVRTQLTKDIRELCMKLQTMSGELDFNPGSPQQLRTVLFEKMKLRSQVKTPSGDLSTGSEVLNRLALRYPDNEFIKDLHKYRRMTKLMSTYGTPPVLKDGRVHSQFKLTVVTGRYGCVSENTMILTRFGEVPIRDITVGTEVLTHKGNWKRVTQLVYKGIDEMYRIEVGLGRPIECTNGHRLYTRNGWTYVRDLKEGDIVVYVSKHEISKRSDDCKECLSNVFIKGKTHDCANCKKHKTHISYCNVHTKDQSFRRVPKARTEAPIFQEFNRREEWNVQKKREHAPKLQGRVLRQQRIFNKSSRRQKALCTSNSNEQTLWNTPQGLAKESCNPSHRWERGEQRSWESRSRNLQRTPSSTRKLVKISKKTSLGPMGVWDISVEDDHSYIAHNLIHHNSQNPNVQNLPSTRGDAQGYVRRMYSAKPGRLILACDFSQAELITFATLADDDIWLEAFRNNDDIHRLNGIALTGRYDKEFRTFYKNFIFGFLYGSEGGEIEAVAPKALIEELSIKEMLANFKDAHPKMFLYRKKIEQSIRQTKRVTNAFGRTRFFVNTPTKKDFREGYNFPIQSAVADIMHIKMAMLDQELALDQDKIILQLHDAFYLEVPEKRAPIVGRILKSTMELPVYSPTGLMFKLRADLEVGKNLKDMEKLEV